MSPIQDRGPRGDFVRSMNLAPSTLSSYPLTDAKTVFGQIRDRTLQDGTQFLLVGYLTLVSDQIIQIERNLAPEACNPIVRRRNTVQQPHRRLTYTFSETSVGDPRTNLTIEIVIDPFGNDRHASEHSEIPVIDPTQQIAILAGASRVIDYNRTKLYAHRVVLPS